MHLYDVRLIPNRILDVVCALIFIAMVLRVSKTSDPVARELIFERPSSFSQIHQMFRNWRRKPLHVGLALQIGVAGVASVFAAFFASLAVLFPFWRFNQGVILSSPDRPLTSAYISLMGIFLASLLYARVSLWLSNFFLLISNRFLIMSARRLRSVDDRPLVLFLRSFRTDKLQVKVPREFSWLAAFNPYSRGESIRLEELIMRTYVELGPPIAVFNPKANFRPIGAAREVTGSDWHERVVELASSSSRIVVLLDSTENLRWEIEFISTSGLLGKTVFIFPPTLLPATNRRPIYEMIRTMVLQSDDNLLDTISEENQPTVLVCHKNATMVVVSHTTTLADYEISLQLAERFLMTESILSPLFDPNIVPLKVHELRSLELLVHEAPANPLELSNEELRAVIVVLEYTFTEVVRLLAHDDRVDESIWQKAFDLVEKFPRQMKAPFTDLVFRSGHPAFLMPQAVTLGKLMKSKELNQELLHRARSDVPLYILNALNLPYFLNRTGHPVSSKVMAQLEARRKYVLSQSGIDSLFAEGLRAASYLAR